MKDEKEKIEISDEIRAEIVKVFPEFSINSRVMYVNRGSVEIPILGGGAWVTKFKPLNKIYQADYCRAKDILFLKLNN